MVFCEKGVVLGEREVDVGEKKALVEKCHALDEVHALAEGSHASGWHGRQPTDADAELLTGNKRCDAEVVEGRLGAKGRWAMNSRLRLGDIRAGIVLLSRPRTDERNNE